MSIAKRPIGSILRPMEKHYVSKRDRLVPQNETELCSYVGRAFHFASMQEKPNNALLCSRSKLVSSA